MGKRKRFKMKMFKTVNDCSYARHDSCKKDCELNKSLEQDDRRIGPPPRPRAIILLMDMFKSLGFLEMHFVWPKTIACTQMSKTKLSFYELYGM